MNVNDAPVLDTSASPQLSAINEDAGMPVGQVGTLVSDLIDAGGTRNNFSDIDGDLPGIAITGTNLRGGSLWFSNDDGSTWLDVGAVSEASPQLFADTTTRLYYEPAADFSGSISDVITMRAWDRNVEWTQLGSDIDGEAAGDLAGLDVSISDDGNIVAIGARYNSAMPIEAGMCAYISGMTLNGYKLTQTLKVRKKAAVRVIRLRFPVTDSRLLSALLERTLMVAVQVKHAFTVGMEASGNQLGNAIDGDAAIDWFGDSVNLSDDGNTVIIGARHNVGAMDTKPATLECIGGMD